MSLIFFTVIIKWGQKCKRSSDCSKSSDENFGKEFDLPILSTTRGNKKSKNGHPFRLFPEASPKRPTKNNSLDLKIKD